MHCQARPRPLRSPCIGGRDSVPPKKIAAALAAAARPAVVVGDGAGSRHAWGWLSCCLLCLRRSGSGCACTACPSCPGREAGGPSPAAHPHLHQKHMHALNLSRDNGARSIGAETNQLTRRLAMWLI
eukprot:1158157-Pelagomonas_calceolata.AAC.4